ncbi:MAG: DUF4124 domain-containing protein [Rhodanobacteraceae bacterium]|jgi:hypothetical protein|nr:DUF4124 domain-containing protein [Rhodanobacteraceae bacterium]
MRAPITHGLGLLLLFALASVDAHADMVYRCRGSDGALAYQDRPCPAAQQQTQLELAAPALASAAADTAVETPRRASGRASRPPRKAARPERVVQSWECRAANGAVFYRHSACPKTIPAPSASVTSGKRRGKARGTGHETVAVSAHALPRAEACRRLAAAGAIGRAGHAHDEQVSTYERNAGRDPCRKF